MNNIGIRLKELVRETGMEQQQVADMLGIKTPTFNGYVSGNREPTFATLQIISKYFNVSVDYIIGSTNVRNLQLSHMTQEMIEFVCDPQNIDYIEMAMDIRGKNISNKFRHVSSR